jgi:hypothetical protein
MSVEDESNPESDEAFCQIITINDVTIIHNIFFIEIEMIGFEFYCTFLQSSLSETGLIYVMPLMDLPSLSWRYCKNGWRSWMNKAVLLTDVPVFVIQWRI